MFCTGSEKKSAKKRPPTEEEATQSTQTTMVFVPPATEPSWDHESHLAEIKAAQESLIKVGIVSQHRWRQERTIVREIIKRMAPRRGENVYQVALGWPLPGGGCEHDGARNGQK